MIERKADEKLKEVQFGFGKGRGTTDTIYTLNYIVNKELSRKGGKIFAFFADLRAVFDNVDRRQLSEMMKKIKTKNNLRQRMIEIQRNEKYNKDKGQKN